MPTWVTSPHSLSLIFRSVGCDFISPIPFDPAHPIPVVGAGVCKPCTVCGPGQVQVSACQATTATIPFAGFTDTVCAAAPIPAPPPAPISGCPNCAALKCSGAFCSQCLSGFRLVAGSCLPCSAVNCATCPTNVATCTSCRPGYRFASGQCIPCSNVNCKSCTATACTACNTGFTLSTTFPRTCVISTTVSTAKNPPPPPIPRVGRRLA